MTVGSAPSGFPARRNVGSPRRGRRRVPGSLRAFQRRQSSRLPITMMNGRIGLGRSTVSTTRPTRPSSQIAGCSAATARPPSSGTTGIKLTNLSVSRRTQAQETRVVVAARRPDGRDPVHEQHAHMTRATKNERAASKEEKATRSSHISARRASGIRESGRPASSQGARSGTPACGQTGHSQATTLRDRLVRDERLDSRRTARSEGEPRSSLTHASRGAWVEEP